MALILSEKGLAFCVPGMDHYRPVYGGEKGDSIAVTRGPTRPGCVILDKRQFWAEDRVFM